VNDKPDLKVVESDETAMPNNVFDDLDALRKAQKVTIKRKSLVVNISVGRPGANTFFRAHPSWALDDAAVIRDKDGTDRAFYYVVPAMKKHPKLEPRLRLVTLAVVITWPADVVMVWPVPVVGDRDFKPWKSARAAYEHSLEHWTQMAWDEGQSDYTVEGAEGIDHAPTWPADLTFEQILKLAFDGRVIDNEDHPYVRQLRGLVE